MTKTSTDEVHITLLLHRPTTQILHTNSCITFDYAHESADTITGPTSHQMLVYTDKLDSSSLDEDDYVYDTQVAWNQYQHETKGHTGKSGACASLRDARNHAKDCSLAHIIMQ